MVSLILVVLSILLLAAVLAITINYLPTWTSTAADTSAMLQNSFKDLRGAYATVWANDNANAYKTGTYTDPPATGTGDGGLSADFSSAMFAPGAPPGYTWAYGYSSASGLDYFCMYPTGAGASLAVYNGMLDAIRKFGANAGELVLTAGGAAACGSTVDSGAPASFPADYALTLSVKCAAAPSPDYSTTGQVLCSLQ